MKDALKVAMGNNLNADVCYGVRSGDKEKKNETKCPGCREKGQPVSAETVRHLVKEATTRPIGDRDFHFCKTPTCPIVYYRPGGEPSLTKEDLRVRVGLKETEDPVWACYCFDISERMIREEIERTGRFSSSLRIREEVKAGTCECEIKNPSGRCCLGEVRAIEKQFRGL